MGFNTRDNKLRDRYLRIKREAELRAFLSPAFRSSSVDRPADVAAGQAARDTMKRLEELAAKRAEAAKQAEKVIDTPEVEL